jgi:hypothetical protein
MLADKFVEGPGFNDMSFDSNIRLAASAMFRRRVAVLSDFYGKRDLGLKAAPFIS